MALDKFTKRVLPVLQGKEKQINIPSNSPLSHLKNTQKSSSAAKKKLDVLSIEKIQKRNIEKHEKMLKGRGLPISTQAFMAADLLLLKPAVHTLKFDLESFYYFLLYIGTMYEGPGRRITKGPIAYFIYHWTHTEIHSDKLCGHEKRDLKMGSDDDYRTLVISALTLYMADLSIMFLELMRALRENTNETVSHDNFVRILEEAKAGLPDIDETPMKRKLERDPSMLKNPPSHHKSLVSANAAVSLQKNSSPEDAKAALATVKAQLLVEMDENWGEEEERIDLEEDEDGDDNDVWKGRITTFMRQADLQRSAVKIMMKRNATKMRTALMRIETLS